MSRYWAFWLGGLALSAGPLAHWFFLGRMFAVSGRYTALVDRLRNGVAEPEMTDAEMVEALRQMTRETFGEEAVGSQMDLPTAPIVKPAQPPWIHALFLFSLVVGGALSAWSSGTLHYEFGLRSEIFPRLFGDSAVATAAVLGTGGLLVGFGTRMAGGCTSGHGLCGVSRFQLGSFVSTAAFFGMGVALSLILSRFV